MTLPILIVDDSMTVRADLEEAFGAKNLATVSCASLAQARAALATTSFGLAILDVILPDGDGIDLLRELRALPGSAQLPVLMLSSEAQVRDRIRGLEMGSNDYVGKPYDREYVIARATELLGARSASGGAISVLLIDDSATFREQLSDLLRAQGYSVATAASGEEGLRSISLLRPDAVVVDGLLPGIDGAAVVRKLRLDAALRHIPCVLLTGSEDGGAELRALDSGADAFVRKDEDVDLILARVTAVLRKVGEGRAQHTDSLLGAKKILAVDDSPTYLHQLADILGGEGYDVILAESGEDALVMAAAQQLDCILLDRLMPGLGGTETCQRLKADPATRDVPLIMLTAMEDREAMIEALSTGADDYVLKSSEFDVLKARVRAQLRRRQFEDESRRIRIELMNKEFEAAEMRAARALVESRTELLTMLEQKNLDLESVIFELRERQAEIAEKNHQLEQANRLKSEFLSNMSHELRTPLNAIIGFSDLLAGGIVGPLNPRQKTCVGHVHSSGKHLLALINDILDLSKVESGKMTLLPEMIDLDALLAASLSIVQDAAMNRRIALSWQGCPGLARIEADLRKSKQMLYNLLSNAVKFSSDGGAVALSAHRSTRAAVLALAGPALRVLPLPAGECDEFVELRVRDSGAGIRPQDLALLFETFRQLDSSLTRHYEGSGLGLSLVARMAELHGGTVGVASTPGEGAQFSIWLPVRQNSAAEAEPVPIAAAMPAAPASEPVRRALVIEDDHDAAQLLRMHLESIGFAVEGASDAEAGLALLERRAPDLITLDLLLPDAIGWTVLEQLQAHEQWMLIPVVIVSIVADQQRASTMGAIRILQKPVAYATFRAAVYALGLGNDAALAPTVLIVDDARTTEALAAGLAEFNYKVISCHDGRSALAAAPPKIDLVIIGLLLADSSGLAVIDALRARSSGAVPVLVLTPPGLAEEDKRRLNGSLMSSMERDSLSGPQFLFEVRRALQMRMPDAPNHSEAPDGTHPDR